MNGWLILLLSCLKMHQSQNYTAHCDRVRQWEGMGMGNSWFRYYSESLNDPKVQTLPAEVFKIWVNCLCLASQNDGTLGDVSCVSFALRETKESVSSAFHMLKERGMVETVGETLHETFHIKNWKKRQYISDTSTERVRKYRKQKQKRYCNVTETPPDTDSDTDSDSLIFPFDKSKEKIARETRAQENFSEGVLEDSTTTELPPPSPKEPLHISEVPGCAADELPDEWNASGLKIQPDEIELGNSWVKFFRYFNAKDDCRTVENWKGSWLAWLNRDI